MVRAAVRVGSGSSSAKLATRARGAHASRAAAAKTGSGGKPIWALAHGRSTRSAESIQRPGLPGGDLLGDHVSDAADQRRPRRLRDAETPVQPDRPRPGHASTTTASWPPPPTASPEQCTGQAAGTVSGKTAMPQLPPPRSPGLRDHGR
jgi:hypothetical protein